jgi:hypothetical protein
MAPRTRTLHPQPIFDEGAVMAFFREHNIKDLHAKVVWSYLINRAENPVLDELRLPNVPHALGPLLARHFAITTSTVAEVRSRLG